MEEVKTISLAIYPSAEVQQQIRETMQERNRIANEISIWIFENRFPLSVITVNNALYYTIRKQSSLRGHHIQQLFRDVCSNYKTVQTLLKKKPVRYKDSTGKWCNCKNGNRNVYKTLEWLQKPLQFKVPIVKLTRGNGYNFLRNGSLKISTIYGKQTVNYCISPNIQHYWEEDWKFGTANLVCRKNRWYLQIPMSRTIPDYEKNLNSTVVGIDRGERFTMVTYDGVNTFFVNGKQTADKRRKYKAVRESLQKKNTKSSRRRLRKIGQRENRWISDVNHCLSKALVEHYGTNTVFVFEDLEGISHDANNLRCSKQNRAVKVSWAHYQLLQFVTYKAQAIGSTVITVEPAYTSQRCPICGTISKYRRNHDTHEYRCECGFRTNDDRNGAMNIRELGVRWLNGNEKPNFFGNASR